MGDQPNGLVMDLLELIDIAFDRLLHRRSPLHREVVDIEQQFGILAFQPARIANHDGGVAKTSSAQGEDVEDHRCHHEVGDEQFALREPEADAVGRV